MRNHREFFVVIVSAMMALLFGLSAAAPSRVLAGWPGEQKNESRITIDNFSFSPATLTVPAGTKVTWINRDDVPHTVVSTEKKFKSPALDTDEEFSYTFADPGAYEYFCSIHPKMTGKIVVQ